MPENVVPVAYCPDQLKDSAAFCTPPTWGPGEVTNCGGSVCTCAEEMAFGCAQCPLGGEGAEAETLGSVDTETAPWPLGARCAPAAETPATRPTEMSVDAPSHLHKRNDLGTSVLPMFWSQETEPQELTADASSALSPQQ